MVIIITMAGLGSRFQKQGYTVPKYEITTKGKTLFEWSLESLSGFTDAKYIFITRDIDINFIESHTQDLDVIKIININYLTKGQAETVLLAEPYVNKDEDIFIYNIDTYIANNELSKYALTGDGAIHCFNAPGEKWSFVKCDENGNITELAEKKRISDNCSVGSYWFKSFSLYRYAYDMCYNDISNEVNNERYIAPIYNVLIKHNYNLNMIMLNNDNVHVLGTPEDLKIFESK